MPYSPAFMLRHPLRTVGRLLWLMGIIVGSQADFCFRILLTGGGPDLRRRADWLTKWSRRVLRTLNLTVQFNGTVPASGLLACNHLSYLDILVLAAGGPVIFVAKKEVRRWPVFGWLARSAGSLFIDRHRRTDVKRLASEFAPVIERGLLLCAFPEGTSSNGLQVLPFRSSLLEPAVRNAWPVTPAWIGYELAGGSAEEEVCFWRDMALVPHLLHLTTKDHIEARVVFGSPLAPGPDRKALARRLHAEVDRYRETYQARANPTENSADDRSSRG